MVPFCPVRNFVCVIHFAAPMAAVTHVLSASPKSTTSFPISQWLQLVAHAGIAQVAKSPLAII